MTNHKFLPPPELLPALHALHRGDHTAAISAAESVLPSAQDRTPLLSIISLAALRMGSPQRAIPYLRELVRLNPDDDASRANLAQALNEVGDHTGALNLVAGRQRVNFLRIAGFAHQQLGDIQQSIKCYHAVLELEPSDLGSLNNLGNLLASIGEYDEAVTLFEQAITLAPGEYEIYLNLADVLRQADRGYARLKVMKDVAAIAPDDRSVLIELALAYAHTDDLSAAIETLVRTIDLYPEFGEAHIELGRLYEALNRVDDLEILIKNIDSRTAPKELAFLQTWLAQRQGRFEDAMAFAQQIPETIHPMRRFHLIGSIADRCGDHENAFLAFERMNQEAVADSPKIDALTFRESIEREMVQWTPEWSKKWKVSGFGDRERSPVFLVGFPRSGTTLLDTMLMGLPEVCILEEKPMLASLLSELGSGPLPDLPIDQVESLRNRYFDSAQTFGWNPERLLIDKHPLHMSRVPQIRRLFPSARFIFVERHPYDVVLSCFMANFQLNWAMRSFTTLEETAATYDTVFSAWETAKTLFDFPIYTVRYERLIDDAKSELEPVVNSLGLQWHEQVLDHVSTANLRGRVRTASYSQIGEAIYTRAKYRWKRYLKPLQPVLPVLRPWAKKMGYETDIS